MRMGGLPLGLAHDVKVRAAGEEGPEPVLVRRGDGHVDARRTASRREMEALFAAPRAEDGVIDLADPRRARLRRHAAREPVRGDVAVAAAASRRRRRSSIASAARTIDADGLALMPGIIDSHTHFDAQITWDPTLSPSPALGVTTAVIGNCGFTIAPCRPADRELTMRNLTQVEGMSLDALRAGIDWGFETFGEYMAQLRRKGSAVNVAAYVGHSSVRTYVMGADAARRAATAAEIAQMQAIVRDAMAHGAVGFASSTSPAHNGEGGLPMPSRLADDAEMAALVGAMGEGGRGVYMLTKGGAHEGRRSSNRSPPPPAGR